MNPKTTALLVVDPFNDFLSEGGKLWPMIQSVATEVGLLRNLRTVVSSAREAGTTVMFVPHRRWKAGDYESWSHPNPSQVGISSRHLFARGEWGGDWHPDFIPEPDDVVISEHWAQSGFANTDLDLQLKQRRISDVVLVGLLANTCIESTGRYAMELGYRVTLVRDATAAFKREMMHAAHELNGPTFAHRIVTTAELVSALSTTL